VPRPGKRVALFIEGWWTSLLDEEQTIIALYADHSTSEHQPSCDSITHRRVW